MDLAVLSLANMDTFAPCDLTDAPRPIPTPPAPVAPPQGGMDGMY